MQKRTLIFILLTIILGGCSSLRKSRIIGKSFSDTFKKGDFFQSVRENNITNEGFFIRKAEVQISLDGTKQSVIASVKFKKPDSALLSIRTWIGFEVARMLITGDTVIVNDRLNRRIISSTPEYFRKKYGIEPFMIFMIFGDLMIESSDFAKTGKCENGIYETSERKGNDSFKFRFDCGLKKISRAVIESEYLNSRVEFDFSDFRKEKELTLPYSSRMYIQKEKIEVFVRLERYDLNWKGNIDFVPGSGYERRVLR